MNFSQHLKIQNLGSMKNCDLDLNKMMVLDRGYNLSKPSNFSWRVGVLSQLIRLNSDKE